MKTIFCITGLAIQGLAMSVQAQTGKCRRSAGKARRV